MMQVMNGSTKRLLLTILISVFAVACVGEAPTIGQDLTGEPLASSKIDAQPVPDAATSGSDAGAETSADAAATCDAVPVPSAISNICGPSGTGTVCGVTGALYVCEDPTGTPGLPGCLEKEAATVENGNMRSIVCPTGTPNDLDLQQKCSDPVYTEMHIVPGAGERGIGASCIYPPGGAKKKIGQDIFSFTCCKP
jgi:hypothetical protein